MIYNNTAELIALLKSHNFWTKKKLGQNFLVNPQVLQQIVDAAELTAEDFVIEIGPGTGILSAELAASAKKVQSIELDTNLIPVLNQTLAEYKNIEIINDDALKTKLPTVPYKLVANIPYYITSPLLNHFLRTESNQQGTEPAASKPTTATEPQQGGENGKPTKQPLRPTLIVLLVQKEVAEKICARAGDHSVLSLQVQIFGKPQIVCKVPRNSFYPAPEVDSAVIKITTYAQPLINDTHEFFKLIHGCFAQKRKTLSNSLRSALPISKEQIHALLEKSKIDPMRRPQELTIEEWQGLLTSISNQID